MWKLVFAFFLFLCPRRRKYLLFPGNRAFSVPIVEILPECNKSDCVYVEEMKHTTGWGGIQERLCKGPVSMTTVCTRGLLSESVVNLQPSPAHACMWHAGHKSGLLHPGVGHTQGCAGQSPPHRGCHLLSSESAASLDPVVRPQGLQLFWGGGRGGRSWAGRVRADE